MESDPRVNSLYTKDHISSPTKRNAFALRTTYAVRAFKNVQQISHLVCTKQVATAPFYNLLLVQVYPWFGCSLFFRLAYWVFSVWPAPRFTSLEKNVHFSSLCVNCLNIRWMIYNFYISCINLPIIQCEKFISLCALFVCFFVRDFFFFLQTLANGWCTGKVRENWQYRMS